MYIFERSIFCLLSLIRPAKLRSLPSIALISEPRLVFTERSFVVSKMNLCFSRTSLIIFFELLRVFQRSQLKIRTVTQLNEYSSQSQNIYCSNDRTIRMLCLQIISISILEKYSINFPCWIRLSPKPLLRPLKSASHHQLADRHSGLFDSCGAKYRPFLDCYDVNASRIGTSSFIVDAGNCPSASPKCCHCRRDVQVPPVLNFMRGETDERMLLVNYFNP